MGETFKRRIPHVTTLSMTRKQIKEKTAHTPASCAGGQTIKHFSPSCIMHSGL